MNENEKLFSRISHDLRNSFMGILGYSRLLSDPIESFTKEEIIEYASNISQKGEEILSLLEKFVNWLKLIKFNYGMEKEKLNLLDIVLEELQLQKPIVDDKKIIVEKFIDEDINLFVNEEIIKNIFNNIITLCLKYVSNNSKLIFKGTKDKDNSGIKIEAPNIDSSFYEMVKEICKDGDLSFDTMYESDDLLVLHISKELIELSNGRFLLSVYKNSGLSISILLPIN